MAASPPLTELQVAEHIASLYRPPQTGRPSRITDVPAVGKLLAAIADGNYLDTAAEVAGLHKASVYEWLRRGDADEEPYKTFRDAVKRAEAEAEIDMVRAVRAAAKSGPQYWAAGMTYLERRHKARWGKQDDLGKGGVTVIIGPPEGSVQVSLSSDQPALSPSVTPVIHSVSDSDS